MDAQAGQIQHPQNILQMIMALYGNSGLPTSGWGQTNSAWGSPPQQVAPQQQPMFGSTPGFSLFDPEGLQGQYSYRQNLGNPLMSMMQQGQQGQYQRVGDSYNRMFGGGSSAPDAAPQIFGMLQSGGKGMF